MKKNEFLEQIRKNNKLSRAKISNILRVSSSYIEKIEKGLVNITSTTNYIQGICALFGYNPEIFDYDEISPDLLKKLELSKFAKSMRKYDYFSEDMYCRLSDLHQHIAYKLLNIDYSSDKLDNNLFYIIQVLLYRKNNEYKLYECSFCERFRKNNEVTININELNKNDILLLEVFIIIGLSKFKPSEFGNLEDYINVLNYKDEFLKKLNKIISIKKIDKSSPLALNQTQLKEKLLSMEKKGLELTVETIPYGYKLRECDNLQTELKQLEKELNIIPAEVIPADNKASEICTLLEYAPEPFKDKLLNKLREYKKDIEEL